MNGGHLKFKIQNQVTIVDNGMVKYWFFYEREYIRIL